MYPVGGGARVSVFRTRPKRSYASGELVTSSRFGHKGRRSRVAPSSAASEGIARAPQTIFDPAVR